MTYMIGDKTEIKRDSAEPIEENLGPNDLSSKKKISKDIEVERLNNKAAKWNLKSVFNSMTH